MTQGTQCTYKQNKTSQRVESIYVFPALPSNSCSSLLAVRSEPVSAGCGCASCVRWTGGSIWQLTLLARTVTRTPASWPSRASSGVRWGSRGPTTHSRQTAVPAASLMSSPAALSRPTQVYLRWCNKRNKLKNVKQGNRKQQTLLPVRSSQ